MLVSTINPFAVTVLMDSIKKSQSGNPLTTGRLLPFYPPIILVYRVVSWYFQGVFSPVSPISMYQTNTKLQGNTGEEYNLNLPGICGDDYL
ncbi:MAG: hypothetical protein Q8908_07975 [Bacteroidota bacterium]|nr:hypothetical protein [Bacteroidota bacterium]